MNAFKLDTLHLIMNSWYNFKGNEENIQMNQKNHYSKVNYRLVRSWLINDSGWRLSVVASCS